ncbi:MAG: hypothetical protein ACRD37_11975, partial [Candidatus Acidiferrales bacterium]
RSFFRLLHADLRAIREGLTELERRGIVIIDCRSAGLSAEEPVAHLREISLAWRQPISSDYAAESANRTFEQLLAIRNAVERTLGIVPVQATIPIIKTVPSSGGENPATAEESTVRRKPHTSINVPVSPAREQKPERANLTSSNDSPTKSQTSSSEKTQTKIPSPSLVPVALASTSAPRAEISESAASANKIAPQNRAASPRANVPSPQLEECLESIWEQLIEAPPTRGRSMSTVTLGEARVLLSAWEVNAFVSDGGQLSEDLRRAVAARALVALAREEQKRSGDSAKLDAAIALGRDEMTYLQRRVDEAQRMKNTEAAVNLGISARRLLSAMETVQN